MVVGASEAALQSVSHLYGPAHQKVQEIQQRIQVAEQYLASYRENALSNLQQIGDKELIEILHGQARQRLDQAIEHENAVAASYDQEKSRAIDLDRYVVPEKGERAYIDKPETLAEIDKSRMMESGIMLDDRTGKHDLKWTVQANIAQDLKGTTQQLHVPVIGVTQRSRTKKGGPEGDEHLEDISFADALGQEADMVWRVKKEGRDSDGVSTRLRVNIAGARELQVAGVLLSVRLCQHWHWKGWTDEEGRLLDESGQVVPEDPQLNPIRTGREVLEERKARGGGRRKPIQKTDHEDLQQHYGALVPEEPEDEPT